MRLVSWGTWVSQTLRHFGRDQRGTVSIFTISLLVVMIGLGGIALDTMRMEQQRVAIQNSLDRCTLMAASLKQRLAARELIEDCMGKEGLRSHIASVEETREVNHRVVTASASTGLESLFPNAMGLRGIDFTTTARAEQKITKIEISLVLDVSGSMEGERLDALKTSAKRFVDSVMRNDTDKLVSISLVPYNGQVNLGPTLRAIYNPSYNNSIPDYDCLDLPASAYSSLSLAVSAYPMTGYTDTFNAYAPNAKPSEPDPVNMACRPTARAVVASQDADDLNAQIDGLVAEGTTSINVGMRWGLALLDPGSRSVFNTLLPQTLGEMPDSLSGRPYDYGVEDTMKIIVLMTDGDNFELQSLNTPYQSGLSPIYKNDQGDYSIYHAAKSGEQKYFTATGKDKGNWRKKPYRRDEDDPAPVQQTWPQIWEKFRVSYVAFQFYYYAFSSNPAYSRENIVNMFRKKETVATMDSQLQSVCTLAKDQSVMVYGIAFHATLAGQAQVSSCASSPAHYFLADGTDENAQAKLNHAFHMIATNITQLKLTL